MGRLYDLIKQEIEEIEKQARLEKSNLVKAKTFPNVVKDRQNILKANGLIDLINHKAPELFGSKEEFKAFLKENDELFVKHGINKDNYLTTLPDISKSYPLHYTGDISDYETIFDNLEEKLGKNKIDEIIDAYDKESYIEPPVLTHPMEPYINNIKKDIDTLFTDEDEKIKEELKENLDYANKMLVEKKKGGQYDKIIDDVSIGRVYTAKNMLEDYAIEKEIDPEKILNLQVKSSNYIDTECKTNEDVQLTKKLVLDNPENKITKEFKEKLLDLDKFITELGIPSEFISGEQGLKSYGFIDYYTKTQEVSNLIGTYQEKDSPEDKKQIINELSLKAKELSVIEGKYDTLFHRIDRLFDLNKVSLNGNLYTGRESSFNPEFMKTFRANLQPKWDNENAAWGVILSGFCQVKGVAEKAGMSLEECLDKPVESFLKVADNYSKELFDQTNLPRGAENPIGKRLAHTLVMDQDLGQFYKNRISLQGRSIEFISSLEDINDNTINKVISNNIGFSYFNQFDRSPDKMWMKGNEVDYDSIKNIFAMADKTDRLYELSNNNYDANMNIGSKYNYKDVMTTEKSNVNGLQEKNNVLEIFKDFLIEKGEMMDNPHNYVQLAKGNLKAYVDEITVLVAGKKYYDDFLTMNNKNIYEYNKNDRKEIVNFLKDPVGSFIKKYKNEFDLDNEYISGMKQAYKEENDRVNGALKVEAFRNAFNKFNTYEENKGKNFNQIFKDNAGGWLEWLGQTTSKQYLDLKDAFEAANNPESPTYGDFKSSKFFAQRYIERKLPEGTKFENLKPNEKRRVEFCLTVIAAVDEIEKENPNLEHQNSNNIINNNIIDDDFLNKVNKDVENINSNINEEIIDTSIKVVEENKEVEP